MVRVELRLAPLLFVWRAQCIAVSVKDERHSLLESHVHEQDVGPRRRMRVDGVREVRVIAEELMYLEHDLALKMPQSQSPEPLLRFHSRYIIEKAFKVRDDGKVP